MFTSFSFDFIIACLGINFAEEWMLVLWVSISYFNSSIKIPFFFPWTGASSRSRFAALKSSAYTNSSFVLLLYRLLQFPTGNSVEFFSTSFFYLHFHWNLVYDWIYGGYLQKTIVMVWNFLVFFNGILNLYQQKSSNANEKTSKTSCLSRHNLSYLINVNSKPECIFLMNRDFPLAVVGFS